MREADSPWPILLAAHKGQFLLVGGYRETGIFGRYSVHSHRKPNILGAIDFINFIKITVTTT